MKKRVISLIMLLVFSVHLFTFAYASEEPMTLDDIAEEYISLSNQNNEVIYSNLTEFYNQVRMHIPEISDIELAEYLICYADLGYEYADDIEKLEVLEFVELRKSCELYCVAEDSISEIENLSALSSNSMVMPLAEWESEDGYLFIETNCGVAVKQSNGDTAYVLSAEATWLKEPSIRLVDTFAITYGGAFDDTYDITATLYRSETCTFCGRKPYVNAKEIYGPDSDGVSRLKQSSSSIELDFSQANSVGMKFSVARVGCYHVPSSDSTVSYNYATYGTLSVTLKFRVLVSSTTEAKVAYAHKTFGADVDIGATVEGKSVTPTFSVSLVSMANTYVAPPVTLRST